MYPHHSYYLWSKANTHYHVAELDVTDNATGFGVLHEEADVGYWTGILGSCIITTHEQ